MPASDADAFIDHLVATSGDQSKRDARFTRILDLLVGYTGRKPAATGEEEDADEWVVVGGSRVATPSLTNDSVDEPVTLDAILNRPPKRERYLNPAQQLAAHEHLRARHGLFSPSAPTYMQPAAVMPSEPEYVPPKVQEQREAEMRVRYGLFEPVLEHRK